MAERSTKPYLIRAIHEWCEDCGYRPYIAVAVDEHTMVPREFVRNGEIVLNVSVQATNRLTLGNDFIEFEARFSGAVREVSIPIENVSAIYAQETGHGMAFDVPKPLALVPEREPEPEPPKPASVAPPRPAQRPTLVPKVSPGALADESEARGANGRTEARAEPPVLHAVESSRDSRKESGESASSDETGNVVSRPPAARGARRRGKLSAVPAGGAPADASSASAGEARADESGPAPSGKGSGRSSARGAGKARDKRPGAPEGEAPKAPDGGPPDEPPPSGPRKPSLTRVK